MSDAAAQPAPPPQSLDKLLEEIAERQRRAGLEPLTDDEAMALALEIQREVREEMRQEGII